MFLLYLQSACENILRREFDPVRLRLTVNAWRLEFQFVQKEIEDIEGQVDYGWVRMALKCDYLTVTYLLKVYFRALSLVASVQHRAKLNEKGTILKLTGILTYFVNVLGDRGGQVQFAALTA